MAEKTKLYPTAPTMDDMDNNHSDRLRLGQIWSIKSDLDTQSDKYRRCTSRYKQAYKVLDSIQYVLEAATALGAGSSLATLTTGVGLPVSIAIGSVTAGVGGLRLINQLIMKKLISKINKHSKLTVLADSKYYSIMLLINKALSDNTIDEKEFEKIMADYQDFKNKKVEYQKLKVTPDNFLEENKKDVTVLVSKLNDLLQKSNVKNGNSK